MDETSEHILRLGRGSRAVLVASAICFLAGAGLTIVDVALRNLGDGAVPGVIELTTLLIGLGALLSMPACYGARSHITARLLSEMSPRLARPLGVLEAVCSLALAVLLCGIFVITALEKLGGVETTRDLGLRADVLWVVAAATFVASALAAVIGLARALRGPR